MPQVNRVGYTLIACPLCDWSKQVLRKKSKQSLEGHIGVSHRRGQGGNREHPHSSTRLNDASEVIMGGGATKRSRENGLRLTDGRDHPVTTRRVEPRS